MEIAVLEWRDSGRIDYKALCVVTGLVPRSRIRDLRLSASAMSAKAQRVVVVTGASRGLGVGKSRLLIYLASESFM